MALANTDDVSARLGRVLNDQETTSATYLLDAATAIVCEAGDTTEDFIEAMDPVPPVLRFVTVELVSRAMANPSALLQQEERLGEYQHMERFRANTSEAASDLLLTDSEELLVRRAVLGSTTGSVRIKSHIDDIYDALIGS